MLVLLAPAALADRQIFIPTGDKVPLGWMRLEYMLLNPHGKSYDAFATFGITKEIEAEFQLERSLPKDAMGTFSVSYTPFNPVTDTFPGLSIGVRDVLDHTDFGRFAYIASTFHVGTEGEIGADHMDVHLGVGYGRHAFPFVGFMIPLSQQLHFMAEHDGTQPTAAFEIEPHPGMQLRWIAREHQTIWSARWTFRF